MGSSPSYRHQLCPRPICPRPGQIYLISRASENNAGFRKLGPKTRTLQSEETGLPGDWRFALISAGSARANLASGWTTPRCW